ncbi:ankyrin repeat domain-containing protein 53 [Antechinus flavipes]|uniref:ankyrin repeat domain-containing protein 53 n=1 Tax=Antechinus flavipes TaxID=38775 RepID=UPI0022369028|nr:ankyrin repeat domain-containing protein 53 [Antechinus flavipes]
MSSETTRSSSWRWLAPSLWASQWTAKTSTHLTYHPCSVWTSACPLCKGQGPEWARVVQEPPLAIQIQSADPWGRKVFQTSTPRWRSIDWDDPWRLRQELYLRSRFGRSFTAKGKLLEKQELLAASVGNLEWLHQCLKYQRDIRTDRRGFTALHLAAEHCKLNCMMALVEQYKYPVDITTAKGWTPLHLAINKGVPAESLECIRYLLKAGASVNAQNHNGTAPLHLASGEGMLDGIKVLVEAGANVHLMDNSKRKGLDLCKLWNHRDCARFLKDAMWKQDKKELAEEMYRLKQLKEKLRTMQEKYLFKKKKEKEARNEIAFVQWLQTKPLAKLPEIKTPEPAQVRKDWVEVKEAPPRGRKVLSWVEMEPPRLRKELGRIRKEPPAVPKEAPHAKKAAQTPKPQPPRRPQPPSRRGFAVTPRVRRSFRPMKRVKPTRPAGSSSTARPSENTPVSSQPATSRSRPSSSPQTLRSPRPSSIPASAAPFSSGSAPSSAVGRSRESSQLQSIGELSSRSRVAPTVCSASSQQRPASYAFLRSLCEVPPEAEQPRPKWSSVARLPRDRLSLLHLYLEEIPQEPPQLSWRAKWNPSTNLASRPVTQIAFPQGVRLGVHPEPPIHYNFQGFLKFFPDGEGGVLIETIEGDWIFPVPRLPFQVLWRELCQWPERERLAGPGGPKNFSAEDLPVRPYVIENYLCSDFVAMSLRQTFDAAFIALVQRHRGFPPLPPASPSSPAPSSSSTSTSIALRQCLALLFSEPPVR